MTHHRSEEAAKYRRWYSTARWKRIAPTPKPQLAQADSRLTKDCEPPVTIPKGGNVGKLWIQDRIALVECGLGKKALVGFYKDRDARLMGIKK
jgi:hypothetical protein